MKFLFIISKVFAKKQALFFVIAFITLNANAQWFTGGSFNLYVKKGDNSEKTDVGFSIAPKGGYYFTDKWAAGLSLAIGGDFGVTSGDVKYKDNAVRWYVSPFVRYSVYTYKKFVFILEGNIGAGGRHVKNVGSTYENKYSVFGITVFNISPILAFKLSEHLQLEVALDCLNLGYNIDVTTHGKGSKATAAHDFNIGFNSASIIAVPQLTIGAIYKF